VEIFEGKLTLDKSELFDQLYSVDEPISYASMAVHHILESDLEHQPHFTTFSLPKQTQYIIGHNVDYDINAIARCGVDTS
ncbi:3'-5' exonuclease, partial [Acinetobacter baumannii]